MRRRFLAALAGMAALPPPRAAHGQVAAAPVVLGVAGPAAARPLEMTLEALEALGLERLRTTTPWTRGPQEFSGVPLARLLRAVGGEAARILRVEALNRYTIDLPAADGPDRGALLATRLDGQPMRVRDRGPVWLVYPWSDRPELDRPEIHERSIWQIRRIELR